VAAEMLPTQSITLNSNVSQGGGESCATASGSVHNLLTLPAEIRAHVCRFAVVMIEDTTPIEQVPGVAIIRMKDGTVKTSAICTGRNAGQELWRDTPPIPALALTCKQVREEVLPLYYAENVFDFGAMVNGSSRAVAIDSIQHWRKSLSKHAVTIKHLQSAFTHAIKHSFRTTECRRVIVRLDLAKDGALQAKRYMEGYEAPHCACDLHVRLPGALTIPRMAIACWTCWKIARKKTADVL